MKLTTFLTPWGRYFYKKLPFGLTSEPEVFCKEITKIIGDCKGIIVHVDDTLVMGARQEEHDENLKSILNRIEQAGMTINKKKYVIGVEEIEFLGFKVGKSGIKAGPKIQGIVDLSYLKM